MYIYPGMSRWKPGAYQSLPNPAQKSRHIKNLTRMLSMHAYLTVACDTAHARKTILNKQKTQEHVTFYPNPVFPPTLFIGNGCLIVVSNEMQKMRVYRNSVFMHVN